MTSTAEQIMQRETRVTRGPVPRRRLLDTTLSEMGWQLLGDEFLLRAEGEHYFYYRKGMGITVERGKDADASEESLWLNGSVYAAIASINGLLPIHASAIAVNGAVIAFTGPAGAGKSTLVAALSARGLPMYCDDTLVLDLSDPERILCLPGHKRLKLAPDALALTGAAAQEKVSLTVDKYYASAAGGDVREMLPLGELISLEEGPQAELHRLSAGERLMRLQDDHYTARLFAAARRFERAEHFAHLCRLARQIPMARFVRPRDRLRFDEGVELVADMLAPASA